jgi:hypothetical protein
MAEMQESKSRTASAYVAAGAIDGFDVRQNLAEDIDSGFSGLEVSDENLPEENEVKEDEIGLNPNEKGKAADSQEDWISTIDQMENAYVSVRPRPRDAGKLYGAASAAGIEGLISPDKLHVTVMYSVEAIKDPDWNYQPLLARPTGEIKVMGEGEYRAIVVMLESDDLHQRHKDIKLIGGVPSYPNYQPHISLKYSPTDADIANIGNIDISMEPIILENEQWSSTKD